jgi:hypothetical protein
MTRKEALKQASRIIRDEANELAMPGESGKALSHRAKVAIQREIDRLREIAQVIYPEGK